MAIRSTLSPYARLVSRFREIERYGAQRNIASRSESARYFILSMMYMHTWKGFNLLKGLWKKQLLVLRPPSIVCPSACGLEGLISASGTCLLSLSISGVILDRNDAMPSWQATKNAKFLEVIEFEGEDKVRNIVFKEEFIQIPKFTSQIANPVVIFMPKGSRTQMGSTMRLSSWRTLFQTTECIIAKLYSIISMFLFLIEEAEMIHLLEQNIKPLLVRKYSLHTNWVHGPYKNVICDRATDGLLLLLVDLL
ncbi:hypothetical protein LguiA_011330 [Lonicera macranthoides]